MLSRVSSHTSCTERFLSDTIVCTRAVVFSSKSTLIDLRLVEVFSTFFTFWVDFSDFSRIIVVEELFIPPNVLDVEDGVFASFEGEMRFLKIRADFKVSVFFCLIRPLQQDSYRSISFQTTP